MLSWNFAPVVGGLEDLVTNQFRGLRRLGHDVRIATAHADVPAEDGVLRAERPGFRAFAIFAWKSARELARSWQPDVILCGSATTLPIGWWFARRRGIPVVAIVYGGELVHTRRGVRAGVRAVLRAADHVVAISRQTASLAESAGIDPQRLSIVPPGVAAERVGAAAADAPDPWPGRRVLLSVGRLVRRKGILEFIEQALPRIVESHPDVLYLVVGGDATASLSHAERLSERITSRIDALGLGDHARWLGSLGDAELASLFRRADLFVLPVLDIPDDVEGFGIVFLEAALGSTASVATRVGGIPDAVSDGETGVLVEPGDATAIVRAIDGLLSDDELRNRLAQRGRERAISDFGWDEIAGQMAAVLRACVDAQS
jgi:phosphatidylinositol alpha-1,6-mannosyltransferase